MSAGGVRCGERWMPPPSSARANLSERDLPRECLFQKSGNGVACGHDLRVRQHGPIFERGVPGADLFPIEWHGPTMAAASASLSGDPLIGISLFGMLIRDKGLAVTYILSRHNLHHTRTLLFMYLPSSL